MFEVIDGMAPQTSAPEKTPQETSKKPYDWSNIVFAPGYCKKANADHEDRLAG